MTTAYAMRLGALASVAGLLLAGSAAADEVADFYKGKTVTINVGYGAGGGYDTTARFWSKHLGKHIPGQPNVIVQNMPGAGSMRAANHLYNAAPKDGSFLAVFSSGAAMEPLYGNKKAKFDTSKFEWIASLHVDIQACGVWQGAGQGIKTLPDIIKAKQTVVFGATAPNSPTSQYPLFVKNMFGANIKVVQGYKGTKGINLAMQKGEVHGTCGMFESSIRGAYMQDFASGKLNLFMQVGKDRKVPLFASATRVYDLLKTDEERQIAEGVFRPSEITRPFAAPPGTPKARVAALRKAVMDTVKDPAMIADGKRLKIDWDPIPGEEVGKLFDKLFATPPAMVAKAKTIMFPAKK
jgi:tripartite-type tricarboxylate transporter receptor subunit TctC